MADIISVDIQFNTGMSMRDILNMPELKGYKIGEILAIILSPSRLNDILPFLHKPRSRPDIDFQLPVGSIFRGMVFGHISVYSNKSLERSQARVFLNYKEGAAQEVQDNDYEEPPTPAPAQTAEPVSLIGFPGDEGAEPEPVPSEPPPGAPGSILPEVDPSKLDQYPTPSPDKLKRWTEIIPSATRVRKAKYPSPVVDLHVEDPAGPDEDTAIRLPPPPDSPAELPKPDRDEPLPDRPAPLNAVRSAKEADLHIRNVIGIIEADPAIPFEAKSDLTLELKMFQMELSKFKPGLPRITEMILAFSDIESAGPSIARLKECLHGLGLLL